MLESHFQRKYFYLERGKLTAGIEAKIGPACIKISLVSANTNRLHLAHLPWRRTQLFETGRKRDKSTNEGDCNMPSEALMRAIAESADSIWLSRCVKYISVGDLRWVASSLALKRSLVT
jgi:hypothetical protein